MGNQSINPFQRRCLEPWMTWFVIKPYWMHLILSQSWVLSVTRWRNDLSPRRCHLPICVFCRKNWSSFLSSFLLRKWSPEDGRRLLMSWATEQQNRWLLERKPTWPTNAFDKLIYHWTTYYTVVCGLVVWLSTLVFSLLISLSWCINHVEIWLSF